MNILDWQIDIYNKLIFWISRFISIINIYFGSADSYLQQMRILCQ